MSIPLLFSKRGFHPRQLFTALQGAWLKPTPGYIWQENTGITPTTTGGQTIGLLLDQSKEAVLGPELVTNGNFSGGTTGWSFAGGTTVLSGIAAFDGVTSVATSLPLLLQQPATIIAGKTYRVSYDITSNTTFLISLGLSGTNPGISRSAAGSYAEYITASVNSSLIGVFVRGSTGPRTGGVDNISIREILGNHAAQSTAANRPTYQLDSNSLPLARFDSNDSLVVSLPNLGGGVFSNAGSVYFATPVGMSALHNQSMGTSYTLPALSTDIYSWIVVPQRLNTALEGRLERYMLRKAGLAIPDYLTDDSGSILTDDIGDPLLAG